MIFFISYNYIFFLSLGGPTSADLLKVDLNIIPADQCNASYFSNNDPKLKFGIRADSMICAGSINGDKDTCAVIYKSYMAIFFSMSDF